MTIHEMTPIYLRNRFIETKLRKSHSMTTRNDLYNLYLSRTRISQFKNSFAYSSAKLYNELQTPIKFSCSMQIFRSLYLKEVFS